MGPKRLLAGWLLGLALVPGVGRAQEKFSLSLFHFNVQYVAGGLQGFPSGSGTDPDFDLDDAQVQDMIVRESFEPVLDLFLAHPGWSVTIEMQAYMIEVLAERHAEVLAKLKTLQERNQLELVSFHYSDQLFLAYPRLDMQRSHEWLDGVLAKQGLTVSPVVFCQEGQFGEGMARFAKEHGRQILLLAKNLFRYQHHSSYEGAAPLYTLEGADVVIVGRAISSPELEVHWSFFDDGELLATGGMAPYVPTDFKHKPEAIAEYENGLLQEEAAGFRVAKIGDFVAWAKARGLEQPPLPPMLDGTWQPPSTDSMRRWLGGSGLLDVAYQCERDNSVLVSNVQTRHWLLVAETLAAEAERLELVERGTWKQHLQDCWRTALLGQVSDATGINPFINEVRYGLVHAEQALDCADAAIGALAPLFGGPFVLVDTRTGTVSRIDDQPSSWLQPCQPPSEIAAGLRTEAPGRQLSSDWSCSGGGAYRLRLSATAATGGERKLEVAFPMALDGFYLTPGLLEAEARYYPFTAFDLQEGRISLPLANGLVGLAEDLWLIKQTDVVHVAATFFAGDGYVRFIDDTLVADEPVEWVFWLLPGKAEEALRLAERLNLRPDAVIETGVSSARGCACSSPANVGPLWLLPLALTLMVRKRNRS